MKFLILVSFLAISNAVFAINKIDPFEAAVGAEVILRQVLEKQLITDNTQTNETIRKALGGSEDDGMEYSIDSISCDSALSSKHCFVEVTKVVGPTKPFPGSGETYTIEVTVSYDGVVQFAKWTSIDFI